jgi:hypothetical protein
MNTGHWLGACMIFSVGSLGIGYYFGMKLSENKYRPKVESLSERIKYLENGTTKS